MCLVALALEQSARFPLVIAANRDEFFRRATAPLGWWTPPAGGPPVLAGRDLEAGGTWMGLTRQGRIALVTNVRDPARVDPLAPSRGALVPDWLASDEPAARFWPRVAHAGHNGFNLVAFDLRRGERFYASNHGHAPRPLPAGVHGVSNATLDTPWPKVVALVGRLRTALTQAADAEQLAAHCFHALADRRVADDAELPRTGIPLERERQLSAAFIRTPDGTYGTRSAMLLIVERSGAKSTAHVIERTFGVDGEVALVRRETLDVDWLSQPG